MTIEQITELGFRRQSGNRADIYTLFLGGSNFLHCFVRKNDEFLIHLWIGHDMDFEKCVSFWHNPKSIEELTLLVELLTGEKVKK